MTNREYQFQPIDPDDVEALRDHYEAIEEWLLAQSDRDIRHHLPNLVETLAELSADPETVRFLAGVSFTKNNTPLDYELVRFYAPDDVDFLRRDEVKLAVSQDHHYVRFVHPADPRFDAGALRAVLLSAMETALHSLEDDDEGSPRARLSDLWQDL